MIALVGTVHRNRELIWALALKELKVRYKRSFLGFLWALLNPLLMMVILTVVFSNVVRMSIPKYAVFLISALLPWTFFAQTLSYSVESVVGNGDLLKKVRIEKAVFPLAALVSNVINFAFSLLPLLFILLVLRFPIHWTWIYVPIMMLPLIMFTLGCGFFFAAMNVFFRDMAHILQILLSAWFYLCPIVYSLDFLPPRYLVLFQLNPMLYILSGFRFSIYYGQLPPMTSMIASFGIGLAALILGHAYFRSRQDSFIFYV